jgi:hypothetical protein
MTAYIVQSFSGDHLMVTQFKKWWTILRFKFISKINCWSGKHDWLRSISIVGPLKDERICANCSVKQQMINGEWGNTI